MTGAGAPGASPGPGPREAPITVVPDDAAGLAFPPSLLCLCRRAPANRVDVAGMTAPHPSAAAQPRAAPYRKDVTDLYEPGDAGAGWTAQSDAAD